MDQVVARLTRSNDNQLLAKLELLPGVMLRWEKTSNVSSSFLLPKEALLDMCRMFTESITTTTTPICADMLPPPLLLHTLEHTDEFTWEASQEVGGLRANQRWKSVYGNSEVQWEAFVYTTAAKKEEKDIVHLSESIYTRRGVRTAHKACWFAVAAAATAAPNSDVTNTLLQPNFGALEFVRRQLHTRSSYCVGWRAHSLHTQYGLREQRTFWAEEEDAPLYHAEQWGTKQEDEQYLSSPVQVMAYDAVRLPHTVQPLCSAGQAHRVCALGVVWYALHPMLAAEHEWDRKRLFPTHEYFAGKSMKEDEEEDNVSVDDCLAVGAEGPIFRVHAKSTKALRAASAQGMAKAALKATDKMNDATADAIAHIMDPGLMARMVRVSKKAEMASEIAAHAAQVSTKLMRDLDIDADMRVYWTWCFPGTRPITIELRTRPRTHTMRATLFAASTETNNRQQQQQPVVRCTWSESRAQLDTKQWCANQQAWIPHMTRPNLLQGQTRQEMLRFADDEEAWLAAYGQGDDTEARIHWFDTLLSYKSLMHHNNKSLCPSEEEQTNKQKIVYVLLEALVLATPTTIIPGSDDDNNNNNNKKNEEEEKKRKMMLSFMMYHPSQTKKGRRRRGQTTTTKKTKKTNLRSRLRPRKEKTCCVSKNTTLAWYSEMSPAQTYPTHAHGRRNMSTGTLLSTGWRACGPVRANKNALVSFAKTQRQRRRRRTKTRPF